MAMYHYNLNTFAEVERRYNDIKPIRGSNNIRPLGDRARKWEHIHKVSANKYVLLDELTADANDPIWRQPLDEAIKRAPVIWTRSPTSGIEKIRIRNGSGSWCHNQRYSFLQRALPRCMDFHVINGKQYVSNHTTTHYLPKTKWVHKAFYDHYELHRASYHNTYGFTKRDDGKCLDFERDGKSHKQWVCLTERHKEPVTRYRMSKDKKAYYDDINKFVEWAWVMRPLLFTNKRYDWETTVKNRSACGLTLNDHAEFRNMLRDESDERRTPIVSHVLGEMGTYDWQEQSYTLSDDPKEFERRFKSQIDTLAGFKEKYQDYK